MKTVNTTIREEYDDSGALTSKHTEINTREVTDTAATSADTASTATTATDTAQTATTTDAQ